MSKKLNNSSGKEITEAFLKQDAEGIKPTEVAENEIVIAKHIPEMRKVVFLNGRDPGVALLFHYASGTHPLKHYTLYHGFEHELPVEVIDHLESCAEPQYAYRKNPEGHMEQYVVGYKYIFQFRKKGKAA